MIRSTAAAHLRAKGIGIADNVYKAYVEAGVTIREAPNDKPWGSREFLAADLDGNVLRIASPLPHEHD